jgi:pimeloyl-ACP methyl ester carboxylesterase
MVPPLQQAYLYRPGGITPDLPLFLFLPGMDGTGELLTVQTKYLESDFDVCCLSVPRNDLSTWDELVDTTLKLLDLELKRNADRPIYLCGESFGACLGLQVASRSPHLFHRIVLANPAFCAHNHPLIALGTQLTSWLPHPLYHLSCFVILPFLASLDRLAPPESRALLKVLQSLTPESCAWRLALLKNFCYGLVQFDKITQPVLLIASRFDRLLPSVIEAEKLIDNFADARLHILPHSGHACLLEAEVNLLEIMQTYHFLDNPQVSCSISSSRMD